MKFTAFMHNFTQLLVQKERQMKSFSFPVLTVTTDSSDYSLSTRERQYVKWGKVIYFSIFSTGK